MSPQFRDKKGLDRYGAGSMAGDLAEAKVAEACKTILDRPVQEFGPKHVDTSRAQQMTWPEVVRYMPDFLGFGRFIEAQGSGGSSVVFKDQKLEALLFWHTLMPVWFGIYNQATDEVIFADLPSILWACHHPDTRRITLDEGTRAEKKAYDVPLSLLYQVRYRDAFAAEKALGGAK
jgi:hypothetical protein